MSDEWLAGPPSGPPCSLVVWDFDKTVLRIHAYGRRIEPEQVAARWERDIADKDFFIQFVSTARSRGIHVAIASFGRYEVVQEYMHEIFREHGGPAFPPELIVTPAALGARDGTSVADGKPRMLQLLQGRCSPVVTDRGKVLFFDDDGDNIADCVRAGYRAVHTPAAFTRAALSELAATHLQAPRIAEFLYRQLVDVKAGDVAVWLAYAGVLQDLNNEADAAKAYKRALQMQPDSAAALCSYGALLQSAQRDFDFPFLTSAAAILAFTSAGSSGTAPPILYLYSTLHAAPTGCETTSSTVP